MKKTHVLIGLGIGLLALTAVSTAYASTNNHINWGKRDTNILTEKNKNQRKGGCAKKDGQAGGCTQHKNSSSTKANFVDTNNNGICDHAENLTK